MVLFRVVLSGHGEVVHSGVGFFGVGLVEMW